MGTSRGALASGVKQAIVNTGSTRCGSAPNGTG